MNLRIFRIIDMLKFIKENPIFTEELPQSVNTRMVANLFSLYFKYLKSSVFLKKIMKTYREISQNT